MNRCIFRKIIICTMLMILFSALLCLSKTFAISDIFSDGKGFVQAGNDIDETIDTGLLKSTSDYLYKVLLAIAVVVAVVVAMVLGIQFMWTSAEEKAKVKEALLPFVVGCFVVFGSFTIWKVAVTIGNDAEDRVTASSLEEADRALEETRIENSELLARVENGEISELSPEDLERLYNNEVRDELVRLTADKPDSRAGRQSC